MHPILKMSTTCSRVWLAKSVPFHTSSNIAYMSTGELVCICQQIFKLQLNLYAGGIRGATGRGIVRILKFCENISMNFMSEHYSEIVRECNRNRFYPWHLSAGLKDSPPAGFLSSRQQPATEQLGGFAVP